MLSIALIILSHKTFSLRDTVINEREEREEETGSRARLGFNMKSNTLDTIIKFALGEGSIFMIDGEQI
jgi:hypothetical protein